MRGRTVYLLSLAVLPITLARVGPAGAQLGGARERAPTSTSGIVLGNVDAALATGGCPPSVFFWWKEHGEGGRIVCASDPARPAVLLFHGLHQNVNTWTAPSLVGYSYDYMRNPDALRVGDTHSSANAGVYKVGASPWLYGDDREAWDESVNWFDYLVAQGFTVATWSQPQPMFADALPSAREALETFFADTAALSPEAPPPVVLLGHSRGGLLIRQVLKEQGSGGGRVQAVVTLNSPHHGSELGRAPGRMLAEAVDLVDCCSPGNLTAPIKDEIKHAVTELLRPVTKWLSDKEWVGDDESRELTPDGPLMRGIAEGEQAVPGVRYYTYGGTNPTYYKMYLWVFDAMSSVPQYRDATQYFVWRAAPHELEPLSPIMDDLRDFADEVTPGHGDGLVSDVSARLPWSQHTTKSLNHAEVLWDRPLQQEVARIIASTGGDVSRRSSPAVTSSPAATPGSPSAGRSAGESCCVVVANPAMRGRLGRVVVAFPDELVAEVSGARVEVYRAGETQAVASGYGNQAFDLFPGTYEIAISGKRVTGVAVRSGSDTQIGVGVLRVSASDGTRIDVVEVETGRSLVAAYGTMSFGLPIGEVGVRIAGQTEAVRIVAGQVTDF
jgi:hypothetical protein